MSSELERLWSPTPVYAYKFYEWSPQYDGFMTVAGEVLRMDTLYDYTCYFDTSHPMYNNIRGTGQSQPRCIGEWPNVAHVEASGKIIEGPTCGFYAYKLDDEALRYYGHVWSVAGKTFWICLVELSGLVVEHEHGYKSTKLRIVDAKGLPKKYFDPELRALFEDTVDTYRRMWKEKYYG